MEVVQRVELLERLAKLRDAGALTDKEYFDERARIMGDENGLEPEDAQNPRSKKLVAVLAVASLTLVGGSYVILAKATEEEPVRAEEVRAPEPVVEAAAEKPAPSELEETVSEVEGGPVYGKLRVSCREYGQDFQLFQCIDAGPSGEHFWVESDGNRMSYTVQPVAHGWEGQRQRVRGNDLTFEVPVNLGDYRVGGVSSSSPIRVELYDASDVLLASDHGKRISMCSGARYDSQCDDPLNGSY